MSTLARKGNLFSKPGRGGQYPILSVEGLSAWYGELRALFDISFSVNPGEVVSVIGANGAGKTTLLKAMTGMMNRGKTARIEGRIECQGRRLDKLRTEKIVETGVTMVPEGRMLFQRMPSPTTSSSARTCRTPGRSQRRRSRRSTPSSRASPSAATSASARCRAASSRWWRSAAR